MLHSGDCAAMLSDPLNRRSTIGTSAAGDAKIALDAEKEWYFRLRDAQGYAP